MRRTLLISIILLATCVAEACTSFLVSGKVTPDGRPLAFKNRDTQDQNNLAVLIHGEKYRFIAIVSAKDSLRSSVWSGHNEAGFAIFNTAAYNLNKKGENGDERDGELMRRALEMCATTNDFETFLDTLPKPLYSNSNFGVIDAKGGCAYYETGNRGYVKYDVNDPNVAPYGYLVRTNHGMSGDRTMDQGISRYLAISDIMQQQNFTGNFQWRKLLTTVPRTLRHGLTHLDIHDFMPEDSAEVHFFPFRDFIPRYLTASTVLFQGVKDGENPLLTIAWTIVGNPLVTPAIPLVINDKSSKCSQVLPAITTAANGVGSSAQLSQWSIDLRDRKLFPLTRGNRTDYINVSQLINKQGTGILQRIMPVENEVLNRGEQLIDSFRKANKVDNNSLSDYYNWTDDYLTSFYNSKL